MGRSSLERALTQHPHLTPLLRQVHRDLTRAIRDLEPYAEGPDAPRADDPDLAFQLHILRQAAREVEFMLHPEEEAVA